MVTFTLGLIAEILMISTNKIPYTGEFYSISRLNIVLNSFFDIGEINHSLSAVKITQVATRGPGLYLKNYTFTIVYDLHILDNKFIENIRNLKETEILIETLNKVHLLYDSNEFL